MKNENLSLTIKNVSKTYSNGVHALKGINLDIPSGMFGLLGPNGAGKSSLMRTLATLQEPDSGQITLGHVDVLNEEKELRKVLGYLPQNFGVLRRVTAENLLSHFAILKGITKRSERNEVCENLLRQTNLWDVRKQKLGSFSGGMKQRFGVAIALLGNPKLLIVDEPTAGLDPAERVRFLNLLSELGESSVVILSTHRVEDVSELCTNMAVINKGEILLETHPLRAVEELKGLIWKRVIDKKALNALKQNHSIISTKLLSGRIVVRVFSEKSLFNDFELIEPDLEDVYFSALKGFIKKRIVDRNN